MNEWLELVHGLADGQLSEADRVKALKLIQEDQQAHAEYQWAVYLKDAVPQACRPVADPVGWAQCKKRLAEYDRAKNTDRFVGKYSWALCLGVTALIGFAGIQSRINGSKELSGTQMSGLLGSFRPILSAITRNETPKSLIQKSFRDAPELFVPAGMRMRQFDEGIYEGRGAARLVLEDGAGTLAVIVIENISGIEGLDGYRPGIYVAGHLNNLPCVATQRGRFSVLLTGDRPIGKLVDVAHQINNN